MAPLAAFIGLYYRGVFSLGSIYIGFVLIPLIELFSSGSQENHSPDLEEERVKNRFFDVLLYLNFPILYGLIFYFFYIIQHINLSVYETIALCLNIGLIIGTIGINVAHELGHRQNTFEQFLSKSLLLSALYMHFFIEHNRGHHKHVATYEDPASSRKNESLYEFWLRSVTQGWLSAWRLERSKLQKMNAGTFSLKNEMLCFQLIQMGYVLAVGFFFSWLTAAYAIVIAVIGFLLLETVNYIEHYGLRRKKMENGRYEAVKPYHSWNSNHPLGRIYLYELTRHSDHHFKASRRYQVLRHFDEAPELPFGYPGSMLVALIPPLWFSVMNPKVELISRSGSGL